LDFFVFFAKPVPWIEVVGVEAWANVRL